MPRGLFVTGTDTGIGKTFVSCGILRALARRGVRVAAYKPAETGCARRAGSLVGADCALLAEAAKSGQPPDEVASLLFEAPAAPLVAAEEVGRPIDPEALLADFSALAARHDFVLVEGAGGLRVPIAADFTYAELAQRLELPVLCVVGAKLGCINHALLTLEALEALDVEIAGYVLNHFLPHEDGGAGYAGAEVQLALSTNRVAIARFTRQRDLGSLPHCTGAEPEPDRLADLVEAHLDLSIIADGLVVSLA